MQVYDCILTLIHVHPQTRIVSIGKKRKEKSRLIKLLTKCDIAMENDNEISHDLGVLSDVKC